MNKQPYVMVMVSDMKRSVRFYKELLGLKLRSESSEWTEFETGDATIALHGGGVKRKVAKGPSKTSDLAGTCSLGFVVDNLDRVFQELKSKGVTFAMPPREREGEGIKLAVCLDPDGLPISLSQHN
jgi:lactoylglutathione lyase